MSVLHPHFRSSTSALHEELDSCTELRVLKGLEVTQPNYLDTLERLYKPHAVLEKVVHNAIETLDIEIHYNVRYPALEQDIAQLSGVKPDNIEIVHLNITLADTAGYLYLLEGSKLGSIHIARLLKKRFTETVPTAFFDLANHSATEWEQFWGFMDKHIKTEAAIDKAVNAAQRAFRFYIESVKRNAPAYEFL